MEWSNLRICKVSASYCDFLRQYDSRVPQNSNEKDNRPFIGVVLEINDKTYYAPLSSPKEKHMQMKNTIDFLKIENGKYGAINFNNMIPVTHNDIIAEDYSIHNTDTQEEKKYKNLVYNQIVWCNSNKQVIYKKAKQLYKSIVYGKPSEGLRNRCCDFKKLERALNIYIAKQIGSNPDKSHDNISDMVKDAQERSKDTISSAPSSTITNKRR